MAVVFFVFLTGYNLAMRLLGVGAKAQNKKYHTANFVGFFIAKRVVVFKNTTLVGVFKPFSLCYFLTVKFRVLLFNKYHILTCTFLWVF